MSSPMGKKGTVSKLVGWGEENTPTKPAVARCSLLQLQGDDPLHLIKLQKSVGGREDRSKFKAKP